MGKFVPDCEPLPVWMVIRVHTNHCRRVVKNPAQITGKIILYRLSMNQRVSKLGDSLNVHGCIVASNFTEKSPDEFTDVLSSNTHRFLRVCAVATPDMIQSFTEGERLGGKVVSKLPAAAGSRTAMRSLGEMLKAAAISTNVWRRSF